MKDLSVLYDVSKALNFVNNLKKTLILILDKSRNAVNAQKGSIMLINKNTNELEVRVVRGIDPITEKKINEGEIECTKIKVGEGVAGKVAMTKQLMVIQDVKQSTQFKKSDKSNVDNIVCIPLIVDDECIGVMNITNKTTNEKFNDEEISLLNMLARQVAVTINNANLYHLAITDGLTDVFIKRHFNQKLHEEVVRADRYKRPISLIMIDIDHFKKFNDTYGHQLGDLVLSKTAGLLKRNVRDPDIVARYGGEEFTIILPETNSEGAHVSAERIRKVIEASDYPGPNNEKLKVTISMGIATYPEHSKTEEGLIKKADIAMYKSKENGRNRATIYSPKIESQKTPH